MDSATWKKIKDVFSAVVELPLSERDAILENTETEIRREVENLLAGHDRPEAFIEKPILVQQGLVDDESKDKYIGEEVGNYLILEKLGTGGMGAVYLAKREGFDQKVAVKLIKRGMDSEAIVKRFNLERQILSRLNHPNITHLLDGGTTKDGLPYFVMEYVDGMPLLEFCRKHQFDTKERLRLFLKICGAVSFAHQSLVVHRDLKPSNILVTNDGVPKLLDFGIAKFLDTDSEDTATHARIFTPEYASPEQLSGLPITTSADVYSLGVVFYELLSGVRPFTSESKNYQEIVNLVLSKEPLRPSAAVDFRSSVSGQNSLSRTVGNESGSTEDIRQKTNPGSVNQNPKSLRGDIDNIVLKALRKEPERRYASVQEFAEDIRRNLEGLPVTATADSTIYRLKKFIGRNKIGTAVAALILLLAGLSVSQTIVANRERLKAERRLVETRKIANSLMFEIHDSLATLPGATASREILVKRALEYLDALSQESDANSELLKELAVAYRKVGDILGSYEFPSLGKGTDALTYYQKAFDIQNKLLKATPDDLDLVKDFAKTTYSISPIFSNARGDMKEALKYVRLSQNAYRTLAEREPGEALWKSELALLFDDSVAYALYLNDYSQAESDTLNSIKFAEEAIALAPDNRKVLANAAGIFSMVARRLGDTDYNDQGNPDEALAYLEKALAIRKVLLEKDPTNVSYKRATAIVYDDFGIIYTAKRDFVKAGENFQKGLELLNELAGKDQKDLIFQANIAYNLLKQGQMLLIRGKTDEALLLQKLAAEKHENWYQADPESVGTMLSLSRSKEALADVLINKNRVGEALVLYEESVKLIDKPIQQARIFETVIPLARFHLKIAKIKQANENDCASALENARKSYHLLSEFKQNSRLSPSNTELYFEAQKLVESLNCS